MLSTVLFVMMYVFIQAINFNWIVLFLCVRVPNLLTLAS